MKTKIIFIIFALLSFLTFSAKETLAICYSCSGFYCELDAYCDGISCTSDTNCGKDCPAYKQCDAGACVSYSGYRTSKTSTCKVSNCTTSASCYNPPTATTKPAATTAPCTPGCWDCATGCCVAPDCWGGTGCKACQTFPTAAPTSVPTYTCTQTSGQYCFTNQATCALNDGIMGTGTCSGTNYCCRIPSGPTATPTPVCDVGLDNFCNTSDPYCSYTCQDCFGEPDGPAQKTVTCSTSYDCYLMNKVCYDSGLFTWDAAPQCGYCVSGTTLSVGVTGCASYSCEVVTGPTATCPLFYPATTCASYGGIGSCDNCGGMDCGANSCTGGSLLPTPTPLPGGAISSCSCTNYISTASTMCSSQTFLCPGSNPAIYCYGLMGCNNPTLNSFTLKNGSSVTVLADSNSRNHLCEGAFSGDPIPRRAIVDVNLTDLDGYNDISSVQLEWNGNYYDMSLVSGALNTATYRISIDFSSAQNNGGTYPWRIKTIDGGGVTTNWINVSRDFKVWDCLISTGGTLFDGSGGQACNNTGFTSTLALSTGFDAMLFANTSGINDVPFTVNNPSYGINNLVWGQTYLPHINGGDASNPDGDLQAVGRFTRIIDISIGTTSCPVNSQFNIGNYISAYGIVPSAEIDFSFLRDQEAWFQVGGAGVKAKINIDSGVPVTVLPLSSRALSVSRINAGNGLVSYGGSFNNINGFNDSTAYGSPNNWYVNVDTNNSSNYSYQYFYNTFYVNGGVGVTGTSWDTHPSEGVFFVDRDMIINSDFALASDKTLIVIVKGKIGIGSNVNRVDGIFIADGNSSDSAGIEVGGTSDNQLVINGSLYSRKTIRFFRSFTDKTMNNTTPAVKINYQPNLLFNMPGSLMRVLSGWREQ